MLAGEIDTGSTPVPVKVNICGLTPELSVMVRTPVSAPGTVGLNATRMLQVAFGARLPPHGLPFPALAVKFPLAEKPLIFTVEVLLLVTVIALFALVVAITWLP